MSWLDKIPDREELLQTRASLLSRLKNWEDAESWQDFANTYERLIYSTAVRSGLSDAEAKDVLQEVLVSVAKKIDEFQSDPTRGTFKGWLLNLTRWRITDQLRKRAAIGSRETNAAPDEESRRLAQVADPAGDALAAIWETEWQQGLLEAAVARLRRRAKPRQFQIFELYALRNWPGTKVAKELGVSLGQIYLVNHRLRKLLQQELSAVSKHMEA